MRLENLTDGEGDSGAFTALKRGLREESRRAFFVEREAWKEELLNRILVNSVE